MANIVLRLVKGTPLTNAEVDGNFSNINSEIGVLANLATSAKSNLVSAINEVASESTSNVTITGGTIEGVTMSNVVFGANVFGAGPDPWSLVTSNTTASSKARLLANTALSSFTITLPSSPTVGNEIFIADAYNFAAKSANVYGNGNKIAGDTANLELDVQGALVQLVYDGNTNWKVYYSSMNEGFGSMAYQDSGNVSITGGAITGATITGATITGGSLTGASNIASTGNVFSTYYYGNGAFLTGVVTSGGGATLTNDVSTNFEYLVGMANATTGTWTTAYVANTKLYFNPSTGTLTATDFNSLSDIALKEDITDINSPSSIIEKLSGVEFIWKDNGRKASGFIAQEVEKSIPHLVGNTRDGIKTVNYQGIIAYLVETVKELNARIKDLEKKNGV